MVVLQNISVSLKDQYLSQRMFVCMYDIVYNRCCPRDAHTHTHKTTITTTTDAEVESL